MSRYSAQALYELIPAVYRSRDAERGYPLRDLVEILAAQAQVLELDIQRLYDNHFVETCEPWAVPYIGQLIGLRNLPPLGTNGRAETANMIGYRRRKGTAAVLEQLARDVTGWTSRVVEFFELLPTTQYMNHLRLHRPRTPDLRNANALDHLNKALDSSAHTVDVRRVATRSGRHNIRNIGLYVHRLGAFPLQLIEPEPVNVAAGQYTFSTLGCDMPLFHNPPSETGPASIAEEIHLAAPIRMRALHEDREAGTGAYYGAGASIALMVPDGAGWSLLGGLDVVACDLEDFTRALPPATVGIDPLRGRLKFSDPADRPEDLRVTCYQGFSAPIGGGQYERASSLTAPRTSAVGAGFFSNLADALVDAQASWNPGEDRVIEIIDSRTYRDALPPVVIPAGSALVIRASNEQRPTLRLPGDLNVSGGEGSALELNGLLISGAGLVVNGNLDRLTISHCTLVPGRSLALDNTPASPGAVSLTINANTVEASIRSSILGALRTAPEVAVDLSDSILDAHQATNIAYGGVESRYGGPLTIARCTVIGAIDTAEMTLGEDSIFLGVVTAERRQSGCVRFSWVPRGSRVPRRFHCQPSFPDGATAGLIHRIEGRLRPRFTTLVYGKPAYAQLDWRGATEIYRGASTGSEMGAFSNLFQPQREDGLRVRLDEFLPAGLEAGIFFAT